MAQNSLPRPGPAPEILLPGLVSTPDEHEFGGAFGPRGRSLYFNRGRRLLVTRSLDGRWGPAEPVFPGSQNFDKELVVHPSGSRAFFVSDRGPAGVWQAEWRDGGWGNPRYLFPGGRVSVTPEGELLLTDTRGPRETWTIAEAEPTVDGFSDPETVAGGWEMPSPEHYPGTHPAVSPDGTRVVFHAFRLGAWGRESDLFVVCREEDGRWGEAILIPPAVSTGREMLPAFSPDGEALLFTRDGDLCWVAASVLPPCSPEQR